MIRFEKKKPPPPQKKKKTDNTRKICSLSSSSCSLLFFLFFLEGGRLEWFFVRKGVEAGRGGEGAGIPQKRFFLVFKLSAHPLPFFHQRGGLGTHPMPINILRRVLCMLLLKSLTDNYDMYSLLPGKIM